MKNNERGSFQITAMVFLAVLAVGIAFFTWKYYRDMQRYAKGPRATLFARILKKSMPGKNAVRAYPFYRITGALKNRHILHKEMPVYPLWAEKEGISGRVQLVFRVNQEGEVYPNVWVTQTMGHQDFDDAAVQALKHWRFAPAMAAASEQEPHDMFQEPTPGQVGTIHFTYSLSNAPLHS